MKKGRAEINPHEHGAAPAAEALVLIFLAAVPSLVIPFAENPFEPHKAALLWVATAAATAALLASPSRVIQLLRERTWTRRLAIAAGCSIASIAASSILSAAPALAWWGSGVRRFGAITEIALACTAIVVAVLASDPARFGRIVTAAVVGSIAPTLYGTAQWLGVDPLRLDARLLERPGGTFGNPLWLSGYLVAVMPLTIAYAASADRPLRRRAGAALAGLQAIGVLATRSRGPMFALGVAAVVVGTAIVAIRGRRHIAAAAAATIAVAAVAAVIAIPRWATPESNAGASAVEHDDRGSATIVVRALLWRAAGAGMRGAGARRAVFGSGPESMPLVLTAYAAAAPDASLEAPDEVPDRAHNDTLDRAVMFGGAGVAARLATLYVAAGAALAAIGLLRRTDASRFAAGAAGATAIGVAAGWALGGAWTLAISTPAAVFAFACAWIARGDPDRTPARDRVLWTLAAAGCWIAHLVDIHTSIASIASAMAGSLALALTVACADRSPGVPVIAPAAPDRPRRATADALAVLVGVASALMLVALTTPVAGVTAPVVTLTASTLLAGNVLIAGDPRSLVVSVAVLIASMVIWLPLGNAGGTPDVQGGALAGHIELLAAILAAASLIVAWRLAEPPIVGRTMLVQVLALAVAAALVGRGARRASMADVLLGSGRACETRGDLECARTQYAEVLAENPQDARAHTRMARVLLTRADSSGSAQQRDELFAQAAAHLAVAESADPFDYHHPRNEASLERRWARQLTASDRARHLDRADASYAAAIARAPSVAPLWVEWANLRLEQHKIDEALDKLEHAVALGRAAGATLVGDALLSAIGVDVHGPGGLAAAAAALRARGFVRLADLYAARASAAAAR